MDTFLLPLLLIVPTIGAIVCALLPGAKFAKTWALLVSLATAAVAAVIAVKFEWAGTAKGGIARMIYGGGVESTLSINTIDFGFKLAMDAVSLWLVLLTVLLSPLAIAASFDSIKDRQKEYYAWMLALLAAMLGVFVARDLLLFYIFFELTLIPMFFIIGIWGGPERRYAAGKFFLFTFAGSVFTLAGVVYLGLQANSFELDVVYRSAMNLTGQERFWLFLAFLAGFAVKVPLFPVHTWLPLAHTEAPTAGSVILAGVLLKLGTYGLYKLAIPIGLLGPHGVAFPTVLTTLGVLCLIGIVYGALVAWVQQDIKKLVAYSSVSHLGFCVLGLIALNPEGVGGSVLYMINHGLSTGAMFLVIGMIYDRYHTRDIDQLSGLARRMPIMAFFFILFTLSSIGLPGLNGFVSEFLTILGAFISPHLGIGFGVVAATGIVLGAIYMLHMAARVIWGPLKTPTVHVTGHGDSHHDPELLKRGANADIAADAPADQQPEAMQRDDAPTAGHGDHGHDHDADHGAMGDLNGREIAILIPLAVLVLLLGLQPNLVLKTIERPIEQITKSDQPVARPTRAVAATLTPSTGTPGEGRGEGRSAASSNVKAPR